MPSQRPDVASPLVLLPHHRTRHWGTDGADSAGQLRGLCRTMPARWGVDRLDSPTAIAFLAFDGGMQRSVQLLPLPLTREIIGRLRGTTGFMPRFLLVLPHAIDLRDGARATPLIAFEWTWCFTNGLRIFGVVRKSPAVDCPNGPLHRYANHTHPPVRKSDQDYPRLLA